MPETCPHVADTQHADPAAAPSGDGCVECLRDGGRWVSLRMCRACGHVGCCDSSPSTHATAHNRETGHPLMSSYEPDQEWWWCYVDEQSFSVPELPSFSHT